MGKLLEPQNPFEYVRIRSLGILRSQLSTHVDLLSRILPSLSPILFTLPETDPPILEMSLSGLRETMYPAWLTECVNLLWFVFDLDKDNTSGIKSPETLVKLDEEWLTPIERLLRQIKAEGKLDEEDTEGAFIFDMWDVAVARARLSVDQILRQAS